MGDLSYAREYRDSVFGDLTRLLAEEARQAGELAGTRTRIEQARVLLAAIDAYAGVLPVGQEDQAAGDEDVPAAPEHAGLTLVPGSAEAEADRAERIRVLAIMRGAAGRTSWRSGEVTERLGRADTADVRLLMDQMVADGELVKTSARGYGLPLEAAEAPGETTAM